MNMANDGYGLPIKYFYANLLKAGLALRVDKGKLIVEGDIDIVSPVLKEEIVKRKQFLVDMLTPVPVEELVPYFGRLLRLDELKQALTTAEQLKVTIDATPVNGGWLVTTGK
jgi:hypothetical protein